MIPDEQNRFAHEKIMGLKWIWPDCPDYTQWEHYGKVLERIKKRVEWYEFVTWIMYNKANSQQSCLDILLGPPRGLAAICEFFGKEKN